MNVLTKTISAISAIGGAMSGVVPRVLHPGPRHSPHQRRFRAGDTRKDYLGDFQRPHVVQDAHAICGTGGVNSLNRMVRMAAQPQRREPRPARNCKKLVLTSRRERS